MEAITAADKKQQNEDSQKNVNFSEQIDTLKQQFEETKDQIAKIV